MQGSENARVMRARARAATATVTVMTRPGCHLCEDALDALRGLKAELGFALEERDISRDERLHQAYFERIPVIAVDGEEVCEHFIEEARVRERLESGR